MNRIIYPTPDGGVAVIIPTESVEAALKDVPTGVPYEIVSADDIPTDRFFRSAWKADGTTIEVDMVKAKTIGHDIRRQQRAAEFAPHDEVIAKQIPGKDVSAAEAARQAIRDKFDVVQTDIDAATTPQQIKEALHM
jgi:hypothetical protein